MSTFLPAEKGMTIRQPSTANLMLDSADRDETRNPLANSFSITRIQSILNGFFTRIGTTEVVMEWNTPNIGGVLENSEITIDLSGSATGTSTQTLFAPTGFYTQAQISDWLVVALNTLSAGLSPVPTWSIQKTTAGVWALIPSANVYVQFSGPLANLVGWNSSALVEYGPTPPAAEGFIIPTADLRPVRYLDFTSSQLTYNQDLKDASTSVVNRDVLCRWYFAFDNEPLVDAYGFPILMGYTSFVLRRLFNPPKQIRWDNIQPLGNLTFEVFTNTGVLAPFSFNSNWLMTLQISEC